ncbi:MAG TPA: ATP-binding protein, partial [Myxococcota bacterium]|nr:ATP-binding protein [Myxococcota bacterium]
MSKPWDPERGHRGRRESRREARDARRDRHDERRRHQQTIEELREDLERNVGRTVERGLAKANELLGGKPTAEERAYREAQKVAARKIGFLAHLLPYVCVCLFLLFVGGFRPAMIVGLSWGIGLACHWFFAIVAPGLKERMITDEVARRVDSGVTHERRVLGEEHAQRLEELSASIAHEIRNPITAAKSLVQQMGEDPASRDNVEYAKVALDELDRVERSISHLLRFAREEEMRLGEVGLAEVVESALEALGDRLARGGVEVVRDLDGAGTLLADAEQLRRVLLNLLGNAIDAFAEARTPSPRIEIAAGRDLAGANVWLRVRDNGPGMDDARLGRIFSPFYTSKTSGTGLGLAISKKLVAAHGGTIEAHSSPGAGTEFVMTLPREQGEAARRPR